MKLITNIVLSAIGAVLLCSALGLYIQKHVIEAQGTELIHLAMTNAILGAEDVRNSVAQMNAKGVFDGPKLMAEFRAAQTSGDIRTTALYQTIPVVAAWRSLEALAKKQGYEFRVPKNQARNPINTPTADEAVILKELETGIVPEIFRVDRKAGKILLARPIKLTADCLLCHGEPSTSPTGNGKDLAGFPMENWKTGEVHGAFILQSSTASLDAAIAEGTRITIAWMTPVTVVVAVLFYWLSRMLVRSVNRRLLTIVEVMSEGAEHVAGAASHLSQASASVADHATQQAASLDTTTQALARISEMTRHNALTSRAARDLATQAQDAAGKGDAGAKAMQTAMSQVESSAQRTTEVIRVIHDIAFQTNLLSINAAIEAAHAGEAGRGFAVVASEVGSLAQRSSRAVRDTSETIETSLGHAAQGAKISTQLAEDFAQIRDFSSQVHDVLEKIATASETQDHGVQQIQAGVHEMDCVTQKTAANAEELASSSQDLASQATRLQQAVESLKGMLGGSDA